MDCLIPCVSWNRVDLNQKESQDSFCPSGPGVEVSGVADGVTPDVTVGAQAREAPGSAACSFHTCSFRDETPLSIAN